MQKSIPQKLGIVGRITTSVFDMRSGKAMQIESEIENLLNNRPVLKLIDIMSQEQKAMLVEAYIQLKAKHREVYMQMVAELKRLFKIKEYQLNNLIVTVGRAVIADRLADDTTYTGIINYGALGSGSSAVANGDTTLETEVFRKLYASTSTTDHQAFIDFFYSKADTNGTYNEFGTFIDGAAGADTGQLFTHALTGGWTKTASESMTVAVQYTIS